MGDQRAEKELAEQRERDVEPPLTVPARRERGIELGDLRAHETKPTAMEARAEVKAHGLGAVPGAHDDGALERGRVDRELKRVCVPTRLDDHVRAAAIRALRDP